MGTFEPLTEIDIRQFLIASSNALRAVEECLVVLIRPLTKITNNSF